MKVNRKNFTKTYDYYWAKVMVEVSFETQYIEMEMKDRYFTDFRIPESVRDFCPLEYLDYDNNKYFKFLYSAILFNIFNNRNSFTEDFCIIEVPKDTFSAEESNMLTNVLRRCGIGFGLAVRKLDTHTLTSEWKREYITDVEYYPGYEGRKAFGNKFGKDNNSKEGKDIKKEIEDKLIPLIRGQILSGAIVITGNNIGEKNYEIPELIARLLHKFEDSPKINLLVAEIYYRYGLPKQADKLLVRALKLDEIDDNTAKEIKKLQQLVRNKKFKGKLRAMEELNGRYFEDIKREHIPVLEDECLKDMEER